MPLLTSTYTPPRRYLHNCHLQTVLPYLRKLNFSYERERLELPDGDFLDLDWLDKGSKTVAILAHGLEGDSSRAYVKGMAQRAAEAGWDVLAWNCRSCSGELNRKLRLYHHGEIEDIAAVIEHALRTKQYEQVYLVGFSMGGSIVMKYLGVHGKEVPEVIQRAVAISSPLDLKSSAEAIDRPWNWIYKSRLLPSLIQKVIAKAKLFPNVLPIERLNEVKSWISFDELFSSPMNGFSNAEELYYHASAKHFMGSIRIPTLLINAQNDPIVTAASSPKALFERHPFAYLENPRFGGHVGFPQRNTVYTWAECRAYEFMTAL